MSARTRSLFAGLGVALVASVGASARADGPTRPNEPYIGYLYPAGGRAGTVVRLSAGGNNLRSARGLLVSGEGVHGTVVHVLPPFRPLDREPAVALGRRLIELRDAKRSGKPAPPSTVSLPEHPLLEGLESKSIAELEEVAAYFFRRRPLQPKRAIAETAVFEVAIDAGAAPGVRDLRVSTSAGLTNPMRFEVGTVPEVREDTPKDASPAIPEPPVVFNGQILPKDTDAHRFRARKGQRLRLRCEARALIPYQADAVPGWMQATLALRDAAGREIGYADDGAIDPDPTLVVEVPEDGVYAVEVADAIYRGREDFVYRVAISEEPPVARPAPAGAAAEPIAASTRALPVDLPFATRGTVGLPGERDLYRFEGRKGDVVVAEVVARAFGSPMDSLLRLLDDEGGVVAWNDDHEDASLGGVTHQADSYVRATLPANGAYVVQVSDAQRHGGPDHEYALRIGPPRPDVTLIATPASVNVLAGRAAVITVHAVRRDGFDGPIDIALAGAPGGLALSGARIPAGRDAVRMTLTAPRDGPSEPFALRLEGRIRVGDRDETRAVGAADEMMQAFAYRHLVPAEATLVSVLGNGRFAPSIVPPSEPLRVAPGRKGHARFVVSARAIPSEVHFSLFEPPAGVTLGAVAVTAGKGPLEKVVDLEIQVDEDASRVGFADNLIVEASTDVTAPGAATPTPGAAARQARRVSIGVLPALPIEIVRR